MPVVPTNRCTSVPVCARYTQGRQSCRHGPTAPALWAPPQTMGIFWQKGMRNITMPMSWSWHQCIPHHALCAHILCATHLRDMHLVSHVHAEVHILCGMSTACGCCARWLRAKEHKHCVVQAAVDVGRRGGNREPGLYGGLQSVFRVMATSSVMLVK